MNIVILMAVPLLIRGQLMPAAREGATQDNARPLEREGYSVNEAAHVIGVGRVTLYKLVKAGRLRIVKAGSRTLVPRAEIQRFLSGE